jgi:carbonic anhydrase
MTTSTLLRTCAAAIALALALPAPAQQPPAPHWTYQGEHGPANWGTLEPDFEACKIGANQSPIDIRGAKIAALPAIEFAYRPSPLRIIDNGHTLMVNYAPGSFIRVGGQRYELQQFHFHHPSEERVNGKAYPLVAHLVHKSAEGKLAVVAVLFTEGQGKPVIGRLMKRFPEDEGKEVAPEGVTVDASALLPEKRGYYTFTGSLTTPPCSEGVTWFVLKSPVPLSAAATAAFAKKYPNNTRPVQPLNGRVVQMTR